MIFDWDGGDNRKSKIKNRKCFVFLRRQKFKSKEIENPGK
jgi:hypothetical protein